MSFKIFQSTNCIGKNSVILLRKLCSDHILPKRLHEKIVKKLVVLQIQKTVTKRTHKFNSHKMHLEVISIYFIRKLYIFYILSSQFTNQLMFSKGFIFCRSLSCPSAVGCGGSNNRENCQGAISNYTDHAGEGVDPIEIDENYNEDQQILRHSVLLIFLLCSMFIVSNIFTLNINIFMTFLLHTVYI